MSRDWSEVKELATYVMAWEAMNAKETSIMMLEAIAEIEQLRQEKVTLGQISDGLVDLVSAVLHGDVVKAEESIARIRRILTEPEGGETHAKP